MASESLLPLHVGEVVSHHIYEQRLHHEMLRTGYDPAYKTRSQGVEVTGQKIEQGGKIGSARKNDGPYKIDPKNTVGLTNIIEYLQYNVTGVHPTPSEGISLIGGASLGGGIDSEPLIYIDGGPRLTVEEARGYSVEIFETIEIVTPPASYFYRAQEGAVLLTTKSGATCKRQTFRCWVEWWIGLKGLLGIVHSIPLSIRRKTSSGNSLTYDIPYIGIRNLS